jgi:hypothetical protein
MGTEQLLKADWRTAFVTLSWLLRPRIHSASALQDASIFTCELSPGFATPARRCIIATNKTPERLFTGVG